MASSDLDLATFQPGERWFRLRLRHKVHSSVSVAVSHHGGYGKEVHAEPAAPEPIFRAAGLAAKQELPLSAGPSKSRSARYLDLRISFEGLARRLGDPLIGRCPGREAYRLTLERLTGDAS